jgi:hypothetical protein
MLLLEVVGKGFNVTPEQMGATALNVGVITALIVTEVVVVTPGHPLTPATV